MPTSPSIPAPAFSVFALFAGTFGGGLFALMHIPAPWLAGSLVAGIALMWSGRRFHTPPLLRGAAFVLLGIVTGLSVTWDTVASAARWPLSIALLGLTVVAVTAASYLYYRRAAGWRPSTALFAGIPGALSLTLVLAHEAKADMRRVTISQCVRLFFLIAALPYAIELLSPARHTLAATTSITAMGIAAHLALATAAGLVAERLRVPAGLIIGSTFASIGLSLAGVGGGGVPDAVLIPANVVLGLMIAERFGTFSPSELRADAKAGVAGFLIALAISAGAAALASTLGGFGFAMALLAFAPGGLEAMIVMAFALDLDPAYVAAHQVARYLGLCVVMPGLAAWALRREKIPSGGEVD